MHRIFKALRAVGQLLKNPWLLNRVLTEPDIWKSHLVKKYGMTEGLPVISPVDLNKNGFNEELQVFTFLDGGSMATDIALLKLLARRFNDCNYFEIGTWRGESVINMAQLATKCFTLNLSDDELKKIGVSDTVIMQQGFFSKNCSNIIHLKGNSGSFDYSSLNMKFDLIFIDGDHHYDLVKNDTENVFKHLVHDNSVVVWHDYAVFPGQVRYEVMAGILAGLPEEARPFLYYVEHTKSAVYIREKLPALDQSSIPFPRGYFKVQLEYQQLNNEKNQ